MLEIGSEAPEFTLRNQCDEPVNLSDFVGEIVILYFYPRADTPGCITEAREFRDAWNNFVNADATVLGISDDPVEDIATFAEKYELPFTLLSDPDGEVAVLYDSYGEKNMFGRTFDGVYRNTYLIDQDGQIAAIYANVDPEGHAEEILSDVRRIAGGS